MSTSSLITKVFSPQSEWNDKEEFLDVIYWGRQVPARACFLTLIFKDPVSVFDFHSDNLKILGILLGLVWGLLPLKGFLGLVLFAGISAGIVYVWITAIQVSLHSHNYDKGRGPKKKRISYGLLPNLPSECKTCFGGPRMILHAL